MGNEYMRNGARDVDVALRGPASLNGEVRTGEVSSDFALTPGPIDPIRDVTPGPGTVAYSTATGGYSVSGEKKSFESARLVRYYPGGLLIAGIMVHIPAVPDAGTLDVGLGRVDWLDWDQNANFTHGDDEVVLRLDSAGDYSFVVKRSGTETIIPQANWAEQDRGTAIEDEAGNPAGTYWGFDAMDGDGSSGFDISPPSTVLIKIMGTYYGKGPFGLFIEGVGPGGYQRPYPAVVFETGDDQAILGQPNQPLMARYDDGGAATSYDFEVFGRQGSHTGRFDFQPMRDFHDQDGETVAQGSVGSSTTLLVFRRRPDSDLAADTNFAGTPFGFRKLQAFTNERAFAYIVVDPDIPTGTDSIDWGDINGTNNPELSPVQVATQDTGGTALDADESTGRILGGDPLPGGQKTDAIGAADPLEQPVPRNKPIAIEAFTRTTSDETDFEATHVFGLRR